MAKPSRTLVPRQQLWASPTTTSVQTPSHCTVLHLPSNAILVLNSSYTITLSADAVFSPQCTGSTLSNGTGYSGYFQDSSVIDLRDAFYASTSPQIYVLATTCTLAWILALMLFITPRTYFVVGGGGRFLGAGGGLTGANNSGSVVGVGGRPWLQKVATTLVGISLTIASVDTFQYAMSQYEQGYQDTSELTAGVAGSLEIQIMRVLSGTFLWLAQAQTLIRIFPRHKEKVLIKWAGFAFITLDTIFSILNYFVLDTDHYALKSFANAIPALTYLFELVLSVSYAGVVAYYAFNHRRLAFYHRQMKNIFLVAMIAILAISIPIIFFVLDIAKPTLAGWGDYIRWVGAAAASVVVWEWVERIEALEREESKDGILGREIYEGDDMLDMGASTDVYWPGTRQNRRSTAGNGGDGMNTGSEVHSRGLHLRAKGLKVLHVKARAIGRDRTNNSTLSHLSGTTAVKPITEPGLVMLGTPVPRTDTTSPTSTDYAVHYHTTSDSATPIPDLPANFLRFGAQPEHDSRRTSDSLQGKEAQDIEAGPHPTPQTANNTASIAEWLALANPFRRHRNAPPAEVAQAAVQNPSPAVAVALLPTTNPALQNEKALDKNPANANNTLRKSPSLLARFRTLRGGKISQQELPICIIEAQPRGQVWSPPPSDDVVVVEPAEGSRSAPPEILHEAALSAPSSVAGHNVARTGEDDVVVGQRGDVAE
jgi:hypothetical protein